MGAYSIRELLLYVEDTTKPVVVIIIMTRGGTLLLKYSKATGETQPSGSMFKKTSGTDIAVQDRSSHFPCSGPRDASY